MAERIVRNIWMQRKKWQEKKKEKNKIRTSLKTMPVDKLVSYLWERSAQMCYPENVHDGMYCKYFSLSFMHLQLRFYLLCIKYVLNQISGCFIDFRMLYWFQDALLISGCFIDFRMLYWFQDARQRIWPTSNRN